MRLKEGQTAPAFKVKDIFDTPIALRDFAGQRLMISFYRFSDCPLCNLRVQQLIRHYPEFQKRGLRLISFWHSSQESILKHVGQQHPPFPLIPDPAKAIYQRYGVERSWKAVLKVFLFHPSLLYQAMARFGPGQMSGEKDLVPADFLIGPDLTLERVYHGQHAGDHLPLAEIERFLADSERRGFRPVDQAARP